MLPNGSSRHVPVVALTFAPLALACSTGSGTVHPVPDAQASHDAVASDARGDSGCHGDAATWASLTTGPLPCTKNSDCCVVVNGCLSQSQIVAASSQAEAKAAWPYCDSECNLCIPPPIRVFCSAGECAGDVVDLTNPGDSGVNYLQDHCGTDPVGTPSGKLHFSCGG